MNILKYIFVILFSIAGKSLLAQEVQKTPSGEFLIVQLDGSYETYNPKNKVHIDLMKKYKEQQKKLKTNEPEKSKITAKVKENEKTKSATIAKEVPKTASDNRADKKKIEGFFKILEDEKSKGQLAEKAKKNRELTEVQLKELKAITQKKDNQDVVKMTKNLAEAKKKENNAMSNLKSANKEAKKAREELQKLKVDCSLYPPYKIIEDKEEVANLPEKDGKPIAKKPDSKAVAPKKDIKTTPKKDTKPVNAVVIKEVNLDKPTRKIKKLEEVDDVIVTPPLPTCKIAFDGVDEFSGKRRKETETLPLFQFTDETMKKYYEGEDFMSCEANISSLESGYKYITFIFTFASDNVEASYGWLEKDNQLVVKFLDGKTLTLFNTRTDRGTVDNVNRKTTYKAICTIGSGEEKVLLKGEADALRVLWSTGTEDYEIFDVDFFANQLKCINK